MPVNPTYPGVYIEEIPSGVRPIRGVATSVAAFVGTFTRGLHNEAVRVQSLSDFEREYGGLSRDSEASYAVEQFFLNGGSEAWIIRIGHPGPDAAPIVTMTPATASLEDTVGGGGNTLLDVTAGRVIRDEPADNPGDWGNNLRLEVTHATTATDTNFNLTIKEVQLAGDLTTTVREEVFRNLTMQPGEPNNAIEVVNAGSQMIYLAGNFAAPADTDQPHTTGTLGGDLAAAVPALANITDLQVAVNFNTAGMTDIAAIPLDFSDVTAAPASHQAWAALFQERLRRTAQDTTANVPVALRPYLAGAVVALLGAGTVAEPYRFHVRAGQGGRPFAPDTTLAFSASGGDLEGHYGLAAVGSGPAAGTEALHEGPQQLALAGGNDGSVFDSTSGTYQIPAGEFSGNPGARTGIYALEDVDLFNILCLPDVPRLGAAGSLAVYSEALSYVTERRSMMIVDIPQGLNRIDQMETWLGENASLRSPNSAVYFSAHVQGGQSQPEPPAFDRFIGHHCRTLGADGCAARGLEGSGRHRGAFACRARPGLFDDRSGKRCAQSAGGRTACVNSRSTEACVGAPELWTVPIRSRQTGNTSRSGASRYLSKKAFIAAHSGWCLSPMTSRSGRRYGSMSGPSCMTFSEKAPSRGRCPVMPIWSNAMPRRRPRQISTMASSISRWVSHRSNLRSSSF